MRWMVGLLTVVLTGCHGFSFVDVPPESNSQIMPLWEQYQRCRASTDPDVLMHIVRQFDAVTVTGVSPPAWLKDWGPHVKSQPLRTAVDPQAVRAACTLRAADAAADRDRVADARALYERVLLHYASPDSQFYAAQAREALTRLLDLRLTMAASSTSPRQSLPR